ncbi:glycosyltransferase, partial [Chloroflexota bacterium]
PELLKMYAKAGIYVLLSRYESFSIAVGEALAIRTPCLVANTSALSEWVDGKSCFGVDYPISTDRLAELVNKVAGIKVWNINLRDWDEVVENIIRVYEE